MCKNAHACDLCKGQHARAECRARSGLPKAQGVMKAATYSIGITVNKVVETLTVLCRTLLSSGSKVPARRVQNGMGVGSIRLRGIARGTC